MATKPTPASTANGTVSGLDVLNPTQAAAYLQVPEAVVLAEAIAGRLPGRAIAGHWRFLRSALAQWLAQPTAKSKPRTGAELVEHIRQVNQDFAFQETDEEVEAFLRQVAADRAATPAFEKR